MTEIIWIVNHFQGIYVLTHMRTEEDQMYFCLFFYVLLVTIENSPIPSPVFPFSSLVGSEFVNFPVSTSTSA